jgi:hypothetical protein
VPRSSAGTQRTRVTESARFTNASVKAIPRFPDDTRDEGELLKGQFHGTGTLSRPDGKVFVQGRWENDKLGKGWVAGVE